MNWEIKTYETIWIPIKNLSLINLGDILSILPEIYLISMTLVALVLIGTSNFVPASNSIQKKEIVMPAIYKFSITTLWYTVMLCLIQTIYFYLYKGSIVTFANYSINDLYTTSIKLGVLLTIILIMNASAESFKKHPRHLIEYPVLILLTTIFLLILISAYNFITVFLGILGFSLNLYVLLLNDSFNQASREAGIKYFYLSTVSSGLLICGIFLLYLIFQSTGFMAITWLLHNWKFFGNLDSNAFLLAVMLYFIIFGFLFKLAAFPCHLWAPEVYDGSPNAITVLFVLPIKIATFALFLRILGHTFGDLYQYWHYIVWMSAFFSMFWGCLGALTEQNIKRFMAYSSINQMGFLLMGLTCGTFEGFRAALIYLLLYVIMNSGFFLLYLTTKEKTLNKSLTYLTDFNDFAQKNYLYSIGLVIILFSMAGIPPLGGFFGKYFIFLHSFETGHIGLVIMGMITSVIGAYYYLRIIKIMWFEEPINQRFDFHTQMSGYLFECYVFVEFVLVWFVIWSPWLFSFLNTLTQISLHPIILC